MKPAQLRGKISTTTVSGSAGTVGGTRVQQNPLVRITVQAPTPRKARIAVNSLARQVVERLSGYAAKKIKLLEQRIASDKQQVDAITRGAAGNPARAGLLGTVQQGLPTAQQQRPQAQQIELPSVLAHGAAAKNTARSPRPGDGRVAVLTHERNSGVGAAIVTGYRRAVADGIDVACVMAADNQMDPADLERIVLPVARGEVDYAKANRLVSGEAWEVMPRSRYIGGAILSLLTKIASGYWHVADSQSGYTAASKEILEQLDLERVYPRYGFPNDMLVHLNVWNARVRDIPSRPVYGVGERSGIKIPRVVPRISWLLVKGFFWRMKQKYVIRDFHPLVFFYAFGVLMTLIGLGLGIAEVVLRIMGNAVSVGTVVLVALLLIFGSQFTLFAMWFDMESNKDLR